MRKIIVACATGIAFGLFSVSALGAGFETETMWSGQNAGMANAVVSSISGSQSIYFNPAGLAGQKSSDASMNFSPTLMSFQGPVSGNVQNSNTAFGPVFGFTTAYGINSKWAVGIGLYTSGGGMADYNPVSVGAPVAASLKGDLSFNEIAIGTGYELFPGFKVGVAWRGVLAESTMALPNATTVTDTTFSSLSQFSAAAYKVGVEWASADKTWAAGASYRSNVNFSNISGSFTTVSLMDGSTVASGSGSISSAFPSQLSVGVSHDCLDDLRILLQYDFTNYAKISAIQTTAGSTQSSIATGWRNQNDGRIGVEWSPIETWAFRAGYIYATPVVPIELAQAIFTGPGSENTWTVGTGKQLSQRWRADVAMGYAHTSGSGQAANAGTFANSDLAFHVGATATF